MQKTSEKVISAKTATQMAKKIKEVNADIIHVFHFRWAMILPIICLFKKNWILDVRTVHVGNDEGQYSRLSYLKNQLTHFESLFFTQVIALTDPIKRMLTPHWRSIPVIPLGANFDRLTPNPAINHQMRIRLGINALTKIYIYTGILDPQRNIIIMLHAFERLKHLDVHLLVVGFCRNHDYFNYLKAEVTAMGMDTLVSFTGQIKYEEVVNYYHVANIGISFIPQTEYFTDQPPTKLFEYIAAELLVVSTSTKSVKSILCDKELILTQDNINDFSCALLSAYNLSVDDASKMKKAAKYKVSGYNWNCIIKEKLLPVYLQL
ncbi:MAG: glycosyltransferase [Chloroflexia bacterium]|nr:glycosyltransferase [Chloroflexia bacterium]